MISKLSLVLATASAVTPTNKPTAALTGPVTGTPIAAMDCMSCLLVGGNSCVAAATEYYGVVTTNPACKVAAETCTSSATQLSAALAASAWTSTVPFAQLMKCPQLASICGATGADIMKTVADSTVAEATLTPPGALA